jgi:hypothetical protein
MTRRIKKVPVRTSAKPGRRPASCFLAEEWMLLTFDSRERILTTTPAGIYTYFPRLKLVMLSELPPGATH